MSKCSERISKFVKHCSLSRLVMVYQKNGTSSSAIGDAALEGAASSGNIATKLNGTLLSGPFFHTVILVPAGRVAASLILPDSLLPSSDTQSPVRLTRFLFSYIRLLSFGGFFDVSVQFSPAHCLNVLAHLRH